MECWICVYGRHANVPRVGVCLNCSIVACANHGDRPTKDRFWCYVCLQRVALNTAGYPDLDHTEAEYPDRLTNTELEILLRRVRVAEGEYAGLLAQATVPAGDAVREGSRAADALEVAIGLAVLAAGTEPFDQRAVHRFGEPTPVDPRLFELIRR